MITVPTHKHHKSHFKHSKTIYVFTSGGVVVSVQINSRKTIFKTVKMTTAIWTSIGERIRMYAIYPVARFNEKGCLQVCGGGDALMLYLLILELNAPTAASSHEF